MARNFYEGKLRQVLAVVQRYIVPVGISKHEAMSEIIAIVDPWPAPPAPPFSPENPCLCGAYGGPESHALWCQHAPQTNDVAQERERCAVIADEEARVRTETGQRHHKESAAHAECLAGARAAANVAKVIRSGEVVEVGAPPALPHPIGTIFSDGYWNLNLMLSDPKEVDPGWGSSERADVYTEHQVREIMRTAVTPAEIVLRALVMAQRDVNNGGGSRDELARAWDAAYAHFAGAGGTDGR